MKNQHKRMKLWIIIIIAIVIFSYVNYTGIFYDSRQACYETGGIAIGDFDVSKDGRYVVYTSPRTGSSDIYMYDAIYNSTSRITKDKRWEGDPCISPNGRYIAYLTEDRGLFQSSSKSTNIYIYDVITGYTNKITNRNNNIYILKSNNENNSLFYWYPSILGTYDVCKIDIDGKNNSKIASLRDYAPEFILKNGDIYCRNYDNGDVKIGLYKNDSKKISVFCRGRLSVVSYDQNYLVYELDDNIVVLNLKNKETITLKLYKYLNKSVGTCMTISCIRMDETNNIYFLAYIESREGEIYKIDLKGNALTKVMNR